MTGPRLMIPVPSPILAALFVLVGIVASARESQAGCHVADRPATLGRMFDSLQDEPPRVTYALNPAPTPQIAPRQCQDETPAPSATISVSFTAHAILFDDLVLNCDCNSPLFVAEPHLSTKETASRLDRPPRRGPFLV